jgi:hypothetical protein
MALGFQWEPVHVLRLTGNVGHVCVLFSGKWSIEPGFCIDADIWLKKPVWQQDII